MFGIQFVYFKTKNYLPFIISKQLILFNGPLLFISKLKRQYITRTLNCISSKETPLRCFKVVELELMSAV